MGKVYIVQSNGSRSSRRRRSSSSSSSSWWSREGEEDNTHRVVVDRLRGNKAGTVEERILTRLETGLRVGAWWGRRGIVGRGHRQAFIRVTAATAGSSDFLFASRGVLLRVVRCPRTTGGAMWAGERGGTLCGVVGAGHDDGSGA